MTDDLWKDETHAAYETFPLEFAARAAKSLEAVKPFADEFIAALAGRKVVDAGAGPGQHAAYFRERGLDVLCIDNAESMVAACREKGLAAVLMDLESLALPPGSADGIWAYASLLHLPKRLLAATLTRLATILNSDTGILGACLMEGVGEGLESHAYYPGVRRFFAYYTDAELRAAFARAGFAVLSFERVTARPGVTFLHYLAVSCG